MLVAPNVAPPAMALRRSEPKFFAVELPPPVPAQPSVANVHKSTSHDCNLTELRLAKLPETASKHSRGRKRTPSLKQPPAGVRPDPSKQRKQDPAGDAPVQSLQALSLTGAPTAVPSPAPATPVPAATASVGLSVDSELDDALVVAVANMPAAERPSAPDPREMLVGFRRDNLVPRPGIDSARAFQTPRADGPGTARRASGEVSARGAPRMLEDTGPRRNTLPVIFFPTPMDDGAGPAEDSPPKRATIHGTDSPPRGGLLPGPGLKLRLAAAGLASPRPSPRPSAGGSGPSAAVGPSPRVTGNRHAATASAPALGAMGASLYAGGAPPPSPDTQSHLGANLVPPKAASSPNLFSPFSPSPRSAFTPRLSAEPTPRPGLAARPVVPKTL